MFLLERDKTIRTKYVCRLIPNFKWAHGSHFPNHPFLYNFIITSPQSTKLIHKISGWFWFWISKSSNFHNPLPTSFLTFYFLLWYKLSVLPLSNEIQELFVITYSISSPSTIFHCIQDTLEFSLSSTPVASPVIYLI